MHKTPSLLLVLLGCTPGVETDTSQEIDDDTTTIPSQVEAAIRADTYTRWVFEVDAVGGRTLDAETSTAIPQILTQLVDKPDGIAFVSDDVLEGQLLWDDAALRAIAEATFDDDAGTDVHSTHVMLLDGSYTTPNVLGLAWEHTHVVLFTDAILSFCAFGPGDADRVCPLVERGVLLHEIGHILGLVNTGLPMVNDHEDPDNSYHDVDSDCIMYWAYERDGIVQYVQNQGSNAPDLGFDESCQDDIAAIRLR